MGKGILLNNSKIAEKKLYAWEATNINNENVEYIVDPEIWIHLENTSWETELEQIWYNDSPYSKYYYTGMFSANSPNAQYNGGNDFTYYDFLSIGDINENGVYGLSKHKIYLTNLEGNSSYDNPYNYNYRDDFLAGKFFVRKYTNAYERCWEWYQIKEIVSEYENTSDDFTNYSYISVYPIKFKIPQIKNKILTSENKNQYKINDEVIIDGETYIVKKMIDEEVE